MNSIAQAALAAAKDAAAHGSLLLQCAREISFLEAQLEAFKLPGNEVLKQLRERSHRMLVDGTMTPEKEAALVVALCDHAERLQRAADARDRLATRRV